MNVVQDERIEIEYTVHCREMAKGESFEHTFTRENGAFRRTIETRQIEIVGRLFPCVER